MDTVTVLITGAGTTTALSVMKGLRGQDEVPIRIVAVDMNPECGGRYFSDAFHCIPRADSPDFIDALVEICRMEEVGLLIPIVDYEFVRLAEARQRFTAAGCEIVISSAETIRICNDKDRTHAFFADHGIPKPMFYPADTVVHQAPDELPFPLIIKPRSDGRGSIDVYKLDDAQDLAYWTRRVRDPLFEEYVEGREYTIDTLSDFNGRVIAAVPRERLEVKAGICYKGRTVRNLGLMNWGARIASALDIIGPANIQCRVTPCGDVKFFEVNPRFAATLPITIAAGVNMPLLQIKMAIGLPVAEPLAAFDEVTMLRYWDEIFVPVQKRPANLQPAIAMSRKVGR